LSQFSIGTSLSIAPVKIWVQQFFSLLRRHNLSRQQAFRAAGDDLAWQTSNDALAPFAIDGSGIDRRVKSDGSDRFHLQRCRTGFGKRAQAA
jgi:hypothetical protein